MRSRLRLEPYHDAMARQWDELALQRGSIYHTTAFRSMLLDSFGYRCGYYAVVDDTGRIEALLPLVIGRSLSLRRAGVSLPFVNSCDICARDEESAAYVLEAVPGLLQSRGLSYVELRLQQQRVGQRKGWSTQHQHYTFALSLAGGEEAVLSRSTGSNRNHVRKAYKNDWFDVSFDPGNLERFYRIYVRRMKQLGSPAPDIGYFRSFLERLPDYAELLTVLDKHNGQVVGGMLLVKNPASRTVYYPYGANLVEYNGKYVNNFMYWEAIRYGIRQEYDWLDLGRSQLGSGTYRYKEQWGAEPIPLEYVVFDGGSGSGGAPDKGKLGLFVELWKRLPAFITNEAGKRLIKYILP